MPYKKITPKVLVADVHYTRSPRFKHHGTVAVVLILLALILRIGMLLLLSTSDTQSDGLAMEIGSLLAAVFWIWGCFHLVSHFGLHISWGFAGFLFLIGLGIILWAAKQKPKWDRQRAMHPRRPKEHRGDPDSLY